MANIKSAKKRILQSNKKRIRNKSVRTETKTEIKKLLQLLGGKTQEPQTQVIQLRKVEKLVDKAAGKKVMHKNKAARIKSRLHKRLNALGVKNQIATSNSAKILPTKVEETKAEEQIAEETTQA